MKTLKKHHMDIAIWIMAITSVVDLILTIMEKI
jgi:hypothetical protein